MNILWFRDDLRLKDNQALSHFLKEAADDSIAVYILEEGEFTVNSIGSANKVFLHHSLVSLQDDLKRQFNLDLYFFKGKSPEILSKLTADHSVKEVCWNRRYFSKLVEADAAIKKDLMNEGIEVRSFKGSLVLEPWEGVKKDEKPFLVFTAYYNSGVKKLEFPKFSLKQRSFKSASVQGNVDLESLQLLPSRAWGSEMVEYWEISEEHAQSRLKKFLKSKLDDYGESRNRPDQDGTSCLSPYLRFGLISPLTILRSLDAREPKDRWPKKADTLQFAKEIYWREFAYHLQYYYSHTAEEPLREKFEKFPWEKPGRELRAWQKGQTGYPIVDAGMRQLWKTGWMHNRVRMVVASFLTKHLLINWTEGARWFADTLVDGDLASNSLGWQWVAGCGADAAPFFRIFNPIIQGQKFDKTGEYVRMWVPELKDLPKKFLHEPWEASQEDLNAAGIELGVDYPKPIVDHKFARNRALEAYKQIK